MRNDQDWLAGELWLTSPLLSLDIKEFTLDISITLVPSDISHLLPSKGSKESGELNHSELLLFLFLLHFGSVELLIAISIPCL